MRLTLSALALAAATTLPAQAEDLSAMDRDTLRAEIRAYLLDNPEVILEAMDVLEARRADAQVAADRTLIDVNRAALFDSDADWSGGNPDGDLTLVEFLDYRCGYCKRAHPEVAELLERDGNIRIIRKELPILGEQSVLASRFAIATKAVAGDDAYAQVSDALMTMRGGITEEGLDRMANTLGLDADAIMVEMESDATNEVIQNNRLLAQRLQMTGTPAFVLGNQVLRGYLPLDAMEQIVSEERG